MNELIKVPVLPAGYRWSIEDISEDDYEAVAILLEYKKTVKKITGPKDVWYEYDYKEVGFEDGEDFISAVNLILQQMKNHLEGNLAKKALIDSIVGTYP